MRNLKTSAVQLQEITLEELSFKLREVRTIGTYSSIVITVDREVKRLANTRWVTLCTINIEGRRSPFLLKAKCKVVYNVKSVKDKLKLESFSKTGAVFNAIVYCRELIRDLTTRAGYDPLILPLFDVRDLQNESTAG
jgi:preprotein translocase subunit SecB